jgi:hypothetical protein
MQKLLTAALVSTAMAAFPVFGHHAADGIADDEVYEMIDTLLMDTPHAEMTVDDIAVGMNDVTTTTITVQAIPQLENMVDDGILDYAAMLDGEVDVNISFNSDGSVTMDITQTELAY